MKCPKCQAENPSGSSFCSTCGTRIEPSTAEIPAFKTETFQTPIKELATGSTLAGRYQIIEELGRGGMGKVYKVYDTKVKELDKVCDDEDEMSYLRDSGCLEVEPEWDSLRSDPRFKLMLKKLHLE